MESIQDNELKNICCNKFNTFIAVNPTLCDSTNTLKQYYSEQLLFKLYEQPSKFFLPDIKQLPSLIKKKIETFNKIETYQQGRNVNFSQNEDDTIFLKAC